MDLTIAPAVDVPPARAVAGPARTECEPARKPLHCRDDRGEGVISAAIAVLIMAFLGVGMWVAFSGVLNSAQAKVNHEVTCIGNTGANC